MTLFEELRRALREEAPVALVTLIEGPDGQLGAKLLVRPAEPARRRPG